MTLMLASIALVFCLDCAHANRGGVDGDRVAQSDEVYPETFEEVLELVGEGRISDPFQATQATLDPADTLPEQYFDAGRQLARLWRFEAAQWAFEQSVRAFDEKASVTGLVAADHTMRGIARLWLGESTDGLRDLRLGPQQGEGAPCRFFSELHPTHRPVDQATTDWAVSLLQQQDCTDAIRFVAASFSHGGEPERAAELLRSLLEERPDQLDWLRTLAEALKNAGEYRQAVEVLHRICELGDCDSSLRGLIVWTQSYYQNEPGALEEQVALADADPDDLLLQFEAGVMLHYHRDYDESTEYLHRARDRWSDDPRILLYIAMNSYRAGHYEQAREEIDYAVERSSHVDADLYYCTAVIYRNTDLDFAIQNLERYIPLAVDVPAEKSEMTVVFLRLMEEEAERRRNGREPRPFADPEAERFGEPPGSPGAARNAIRVEDYLESR